MDRKINLYLASPFGFSEAGREFMNGVLIPAIRNEGFEVINPWDLTPQSEINAVREMREGADKIEAWKKLNNLIGKRNEHAIILSDGLVAVLDGVDIDSGVAAEIGYASAHGKRILGYRNDFRQASENPGGIVNIQVQYFIESSGGRIVSSVDELKRCLGEVFRY